MLLYLLGARHFPHCPNLAFFIPFFFAVPTTNGSIGPGLLNPASLSHLLSNGSPQQLLQTMPQMLSNPHTTNPAPLLNPLAQPLLSTAPTLLTTPTSQSTPPHRNPMITSSYADSKLHHQQSISRNPSPPNVSPMNRMSSTNGEITITTSAGPVPSQNLKRSPSSLSPNCTDSSTADLLVDSPSRCTTGVLCGPLLFCHFFLETFNTKFRQV